MIDTLTGLRLRLPSMTYILPPEKPIKVKVCNMWHTRIVAFGEDFAPNETREVTEEVAKQLSQLIRPAAGCCGVWQPERPYFKFVEA